MATHPDERTNVEIDAEIAAAAAAVSLGELARADGITTVALDDEGYLVETTPDGVETRLSDNPLYT